MAHQVVHTDANDPQNITNPEHAEHRLITPLQYSLVYVALLIFTGATVGAAYVDLGWANPVIALGIATIKGVLVILFFMHVVFQSRLIKMTIAAGFFIFFVLITMTLSDYVSRSWGLW
ncbi:MAG: oxidase [Acidobacteria bacterium]|nr:oxidase [Acidobacteriota bacterium]